MRPFEVMIVGGAAGTGKTLLSHRLAERYNATVSEFDDIVDAVKVMTTPEQQPVLHYWDTHPQAMSWSAAEIVALTSRVCDVLAPAAEAVVANHIENAHPLVLEGDYLTPSLVVRLQDRMGAHNARVRGVFLFEPDETQINANFRAREPDVGEQRGRARVSWLRGRHLRAECECLGVPALTARPWATLLDRVLGRLG
jgi:2-phosphoglycerate kinase